MDPYYSTSSDDDVEEESEEIYYPPAFTLHDPETHRRHAQHMLNTMCAMQAHVEGESSRGRRGSVLGHKVVERGRVGGHAQLVNDYFADDPVFDHVFFRRR